MPVMLIKYVGDSMSGEVLVENSSESPTSPGDEVARSLAGRIK